MGETSIVTATAYRSFNTAKVIRVCGTNTKTAHYVVTNQPNDFTITIKSISWSRYHVTNSKEFMIRLRNRLTKR